MHGSVVHIPHHKCYANVGHYRVSCMHGSVVFLNSQGSSSLSDHHTIVQCGYDLCTTESVQMVFMALCWRARIVLNFCVTDDNWRV